MKVVGCRLSVVSCGLWVVGCRLWVLIAVGFSRRIGKSGHFWALAPDFWTEVLNIPALLRFRQLKLTAIDNPASDLRPQN